MKSKKSLISLVVATAGFIYGCGGGGGGAAPPPTSGQPSQPSQPVQSATATLSLSGLVQAVPLLTLPSLKSQENTNTIVNIDEAIVRIQSSCPGEKETVIQSDERGKFGLDNIKVCAPGYLKITVKKEGFVKFEKSIRFDSEKDFKNISLQALLDNVETKVINMGGSLYAQNKDDFVTIAVVENPTNHKREILSGQELKTQLRKNSNLQIVWQMDISRSVLKQQQNTDKLIASIKNYEADKEEHMRRFPSEYDSENNRLITGGFDLIDIRKENNQPLTLPAASKKTNITGQEFPTSYKIKRSIMGSLINCDADSSREGIQIGFYYYMDNLWVLVGYGTIYDKNGNKNLAIQNIKHGENYYIILTDSDINKDLQLDRFYNWDWLSTASCKTPKEVNIRVDLKDQFDKDIDSSLYYTYAGSYYYGKTNETIKTRVFTDNLNINIKLYNPYTGTYIDPSISCKIGQNHDGQTNFHYTCKIDDPYACVVSGKVIKDGSPYRGYVYSDIGKTAVYTNDKGEYTLNVECNRRGKMYSLGNWNNFLTFKVDKSTDDDESSDNGQRVSMKDFTLINRSPLVYLYNIYIKSIKRGGQLYLYSYAYDPDGDPITYSWSDNCSGSFNDSTSPSPVWTAPSMERECKITLTVSDGSRSTEISETVKVYDNRPPVISYAYPSKSYVDKNVQVQLYSYAYDPDGDPITYSWSDNCSGSFNDSTSPSPVWTAPSMERECKITLTVSDGEKITQKSFSIKVGNKSPVVSSIRADKVGVPTGGKVELSVSAYDPEGSNLSYKWESSCGGSFNNPESNYTTWTAPDTVAICTIKVTVSDTDGKSSESSISTYVGKEANTEIKIQGKKTNL